MKDWKERAKALIKSNPNLTQEGVAASLGVTQGGLGHWLNGRREPSIENLREIAKVLGVSFVELMEGTGKNTIEHNSPLVEGKNPAYNVSPISISDTRMIPMVSWVKAGSFSEAIDLHEPGFADEFVGVTNLKCSESTIALKVDGDSMEPEFPDGVTIIVDPEREAKPGDFVVARHNGDNEATFKRFVKDGSGYSLMPLNKMYDKLAVTEETQIVGVVIKQLSEKSY